MAMERIQYTKLEGETDESRDFEEGPEVIQGEVSKPLITSRVSSVIWKAVIGVLVCIILYGSFAAGRGALLPGGYSDAGCSKPTATVPQYFQTSPELWAGPTATGRAPFLAQTNPVYFAPTETFAASNPLETGTPIVGQNHNDSIFQLMAHLSPYFSNPSGFGVSEYPLPPGAKLSQVQVSSRSCGTSPLANLCSDAFTPWLQIPNSW